MILGALYRLTATRMTQYAESSSYACATADHGKSELELLPRNMLGDLADLASTAHSLRKVHCGVAEGTLRTLLSRFDFSSLPSEES